MSANDGDFLQLRVSGGGGQISRRGKFLPAPDAPWPGPLGLGAILNDNSRQWASVRPQMPPARRHCRRAVISWFDSRQSTPDSRLGINSLTRPAGRPARIHTNRACTRAGFDSLPRRRPTMMAEILSSRCHQSPQLCTSRLHPPSLSLSLSRTATSSSVRACCCIQAYFPTNLMISN